jgi:hypothetical protein
MSPPPPVARRWIKANAVAAIISAVASLAIMGLKQALGAGDPQAGTGVVLTYVVAAATLYAVSGAAWGVLTGAVLQRIIPLLPARTWIALHGALDCAVFLISELGRLVSQDGAADPLPTQDMILFGLTLGATVGAAIGGIEALVLRKAAHGVGAWIGWSVIGYAIYVVVVFGIEGPRSPEPGFAAELGSQAVGFVGAVIMAVVMLPALKRLQPS